MTLEQRLERLEKRNRRLTAALTVMAVHASRKTRPPQIVCGRFEIMANRAAIITPRLASVQALPRVLANNINLFIYATRILM